MPQGSVNANDIGPVLFLLYINDITDSIYSNIRLFADDSILYREIQTSKDHNILQTDLNKLSEWAAIATYVSNELKDKKCNGFVAYT